MAILAWLVIGAVVGGWLLPAAGVSLGIVILAAILAAMVGAVIVLATIRLLAR